jgi:hypothetical protein
VFKDFNLQPTDPTFNGDIALMQQAGARGIVFQGDAASYARMAAAMQIDGFSPPFANWGVNAYDPTFLSAGSAVNGSVLQQSEAMVAGEDAATIPEVALFDKWYQALFHRIPDLYAAYGRMSGMMFVQALNAVTRDEAIHGSRATRSPTSSSSPQDGVPPLIQHLHQGLRVVTRQRHRICCRPPHHLLGPDRPRRSRWRAPSTRPMSATVAGLMALRTHPAEQPVGRRTIERQWNAICPQDKLTGRVSFAGDAKS